MAERRAKPILSEILGAIDGIDAAMAGKTLDDFRQEWLLRHGIERGLEIISEAARHLPDELIAKAPRFPGRKSGESAISCAMNITRHPTQLSGRW